MMPHPFLRIAGIGLCALSLGGALSLSCNSNKPASNGPAAPLGPQLVKSADELKPDASPGNRAVLLLASTEIPVVVELKKADSEFVIRLMAREQELEVERYRATAGSFELVQAASETFSPPLPLIRYPMAENQPLKWTGSLAIGTLSKDAEAKVTAAKDKLNVKGYADEAIKVTALISFESGGPTPATRTLSFWFVPGKGILKRDFDKGSSRIPAPPEG